MFSVQDHLQEESDTQHLKRIAQPYRRGGWLCQLNSGVKQVSLSLAYPELQTIHSQRVFVFCRLR